MKSKTRSLLQSHVIAWLSVHKNSREAEAPGPAAEQVMTEYDQGMDHSKQLERLGQSIPFGHHELRCQLSRKLRI